MENASAHPSPRFEMLSTTLGHLKKGNFTYAKERCLLAERSAKASHEECWTSSTKQRVPGIQFSRKTSCNRVLERFILVE